jgi:hypothetical protein
VEFFGEISNVLKTPAEEVKKKNLFSLFNVKNPSRRRGNEPRN